MEPILLTELPDPKYYALTGQKKSNFSCHGGPIVDLKWLPKQLEVAKRNLFGDPYNKDLKGHSGQFITLSSNGEMYIWSTSFDKDRDPRKHDMYKFYALHGFQLNKPHGNIMLGGSKIAFQPGSKSATVYVTTSDGDLLKVDWSAKPTEQNQLGDKVEII